MHRLILGLPQGIEGDHLNGNGLDNRRANLRRCTRKENVRNLSKRRGTTSKFKGVSFFKATRKWRARIRHQGMLIELGHFASEIDAAHAYDAKATELFGEFAKLNEPTTK